MSIAGIIKALFTGFKVDEKRIEKTTDDISGRGGTPVRTFPPYGLDERSVTMETFTVATGSRLPSKICCTGKNYEETKGLPVNELALRIEADIKKLTDGHPELDAGFDIETGPDTLVLNIRSDHLSAPTSYTKRSRKSSGATTDRY